MNEQIELHDSVLKRLFVDGGQVVAVLDAYIHRSEGKPGVAPGTGWRQSIRLVMENATISGTVPAGEADVWDGELIIGIQVLSNMIPVSGTDHGPIKLRLGIPGIRSH